MARPSKPDQEKRSKSINIAVTEDEYRQLKELAGHGQPVVREDSKRPMPTRRRSMAGIVRKLLEGQSQKLIPVSDDERKALFQIAGMARNLNQIAAQANAQGYTSVANRTNELADQLRQLMSIYDRKS